jgi:RNA recognition motif-containing protein
MSREKNTQVFVAKLSTGVREKDLDYEFRKFGTINSIQMKRGYAFIEFEDFKDAEDAIKEMDGKKLEGQRIVVQHASKMLLTLVGKKRERSERGDRDRDDRKDRFDRDDRRERPRRSGPQSEDKCFNCGKTGHW